jgi:hypothetical protein
MLVISIANSTLSAQSPKWETQQLPMVLDARNGNSELYVLLHPEDILHPQNRYFYIWVDEEAKQLDINFYLYENWGFDLLQCKNAHSFASAGLPRDSKNIDGHDFLFEYNILVSAFWKAAKTGFGRDSDDPLVYIDTVYLHLLNKKTKKVEIKAFNFMFWYCPEKY